MAFLNRLENSVNVVDQYFFNKTSKRKKTKMKKVFSLMAIIFLSFSCSDEAIKELTEAEKQIRKYIAFVEKGFDGLFPEISDFNLDNHYSLMTSISNCCPDQITVRTGTTTIPFSFKVNSAMLFSGILNEIDLPAGKVNKVQVVRDQTGWKFLVNNKQITINCQSNCGTGAGTVTGTKTVLLSTVVSGNAGDKLFRTVEVPANVKSIEFRTNEELAGQKNSVNIFVRHGSKPLVTQTQSYNLEYTADCASVSINREQDACIIPNPKSGTWYIMFYDYNNFYFESNFVVTLTK